MDDRDLEAFLAAHTLAGELLRLQAHTPTVEAAAQVMGTTVDRIVKSLLFLVDRADGELHPVLVIATGTSRVDYKLVAGCLGVSRKRVKLADAASVQSFTGYPVGAVPPFGHPSPLPTLIDRRVLAQPEVYAGGGAADALLRIAPAEIVRATQAQTVDVIVED
jgi:prolyl-tRNA editing enzyme YbaK/EbsC (Cys-tRNA(Pro) deacylase)